MNSGAERLLEVQRNWLPMMPQDLGPWCWRLWELRLWGRKPQVWRPPELTAGDQRALGQIPQERAEAMEDAAVEVEGKLLV